MSEDWRELEPTSAVAKKMLELLQELPSDRARQKAMQNVVRDLEQHNLLQYSVAMASPQAFVRTAIMDNPDLDLGDLQAENAQEAESPEDLAERMRVR